MTDFQKWSIYPEWSQRLFGLYFYLNTDLKLGDKDTHAYTLSHTVNQLISLINNFLPEDNLCGLTFYCGSAEWEVRQMNS